MPRPILSFRHVAAERLRDYDAIVKVLPISNIQKNILESAWLHPVRITEALCKKNYRYSTYSLVALVACSALVAPLINVETGPFDRFYTFLATALSVMVTILTGLRQGFKWSEKWKHYHHTSEALKVEGEAFLALAGPYKDLGSHSAAFSAFIQAASLIKTAHTNEYIQRVVQQDDPTKGGDAGRGNVVVRSGRTSDTEGDLAVE